MINNIKESNEIIKNNILKTENAIKVENKKQQIKLEFMLKN